jgi:alpha-tubulin suppressor-like RCC1 family protein
MRADGAVFCWGDNRRGQLGQPMGAPSIVTAPARFTVTDAGTTIDRFARMRVSRMGVHVVDTSGRLFFAGRGVYNGAGVGAPGEIFSAASPAVRVATPAAVDGVWSSYGATIATFARGTRALYFGQVNDSVSFGPAFSNTVIATGAELALGALAGPTSESPMARGAVEPRYTIAVLEDGRGFAWGNNVEATLGNDAAPASGGERAGAITVPPIAAIATTETRAFAVDRAGDLWFWGAVTPGSPLAGATMSVRAPVRIPAVYDAMDVAAATTHQCAVRGDGRMLCWGCNNFGALGRGAPASGGGTAGTCTVRVGEGEVGYVCF